MGFIFKAKRSWSPYTNCQKSTKRQPCGLQPHEVQITASTPVDISRYLASKYSKEGRLRDDFNTHHAHCSKKGGGGILAMNRRRTHRRYMQPPKSTTRQQRAGSVVNYQKWATAVISHQDILKEGRLHNEYSIRIKEA